MKNILYLGDGPPDGAARYLLGILKHAGYGVIHFFDRPLSLSALKGKISAVIISDYASSKLSRGVMRGIEQKVLEGCGLLMIGGFDSFTGCGGCYRKTLIEKMLPVSCLPRDDRRNLASGAVFAPRLSHHPILNRIPLKPSPVLIGYNLVRPKSLSRVILDLKENVSTIKNPLLVTGCYGKGKTAAWTSDVAPHWCGGLVDWGSRRLVLSAAPHVRVEAGNLYVRFFSQLIGWLAG